MFYTSITGNKKNPSCEHGSDQVSVDYTRLCFPYISFFFPLPLDFKEEGERI